VALYQRESQWIVVTATIDFSETTATSVVGGLFVSLDTKDESGVQYF